MTKPKLTDAQYAALKEHALALITETVMALHHAENDEIEEALDSLICVGENYERMGEMLVPLDPANQTTEEKEKE